MSTIASYTPLQKSFLRKIYTHIILSNRLHAIYLPEMADFSVVEAHKKKLNLFGNFMPRVKWTFKENQTNRRLISFKVSGVPFAQVIIAKSTVSGDIMKKQPIVAKALTIFKKIGRRFARFS